MGHPISAIRLTVLLEKAQAAHHARVRWLAAFVHAIGVVNIFRPVDGESDEKLVARQKLAPCIVEQRAVGLECIVDSLAVCILFLQRDDVIEEWNPQQRWLAALPGKADVLIRLRLNVLTNVGFEHIIRHAEFTPTARVEIFLLQVVAVGAIEIADCAMRLGHDVKRLHRNAALFLVRNLGGCPMKKPTRQRLVGWDCESSGDADPLRSRP